MHSLRRRRKTHRRWIRPSPKGIDVLARQFGQIWAPASGRFITLIFRSTLSRRRASAKQMLKRKPNWPPRLWVVLGERTIRRNQLFCCIVSGGCLRYHSKSRASCAAMCFIPFPISSLSRVSPFAPHHCDISRGCARSSTSRSYRRERCARGFWAGKPSA